MEHENPDYAAQSPDGEVPAKLGLGQAIHAHYGVDPGVMRSTSGFGLAASLTDFATSRVPLLATILPQWTTMKSPASAVPQINALFLSSGPRFGRRTDTPIAKSSDRSISRARTLTSRPVQETRVDTTAHSEAVAPEMNSTQSAPAARYVQRTRSTASSSDAHPSPASLQHNHNDREGLSRKASSSGQMLAHANATIKDGVSGGVPKPVQSSTTEQIARRSSMGDSSAETSVFATLHRSPADLQPRILSRAARRALQSNRQTVAADVELQHNAVTPAQRFEDEAAIVPRAISHETQSTLSLGSSEVPATRQKEIDAAPHVIAAPVAGSLGPARVLASSNTSRYVETNVLINRALTTPESPQGDSTGGESVDAAPAVGMAHQHSQVVASGQARDSAIALRTVAPPIQPSKSVTGSTAPSAEPGLQHEEANSPLSSVTPVDGGSSIIGNELLAATSASPVLRVSRAASQGVSPEHPLNSIDPNRGPQATASDPQFPYVVHSPVSHPTLSHASLTNPILTNAGLTNASLSNTSPGAIGPVPDATADTTKSIRPESEIAPSIATAQSVVAMQGQRMISSPPAADGSQPTMVHPQLQRVALRPMTRCGPKRYWHDSRRPDTYTAA